MGVGRRLEREGAALCPSRSAGGFTLSPMGPPGLSEPDGRLENEISPEPSGITADDASGRCGALPGLKNLVPDDPDIFTILRGPLKRA